jgi:hypothetical protein
MGMSAIHPFCSSTETKIQSHSSEAEAMGPQPSTAMHNAGATNILGDKENYQSQRLDRNVSTLHSRFINKD